MHSVTVFSLTVIIACAFALTLTPKYQNSPVRSCSLIRNNVRHTKYFGVIKKPLQFSDQFLFKLEFKFMGTYFDFKI